MDNKPKVYYRIFEDKHGKPHTLFHGVQGSRCLNLDTWIDADIKTVHDGSRATAKEYTSGFHVLKTFAETVAFLNKFEYLDHRTICRVYVDESSGLRRKGHSKSTVFLAHRMMIKEKDWEKRVNAAFAFNIMKKARRLSTINQIRKINELRQNAMLLSAKT